LCEKEKLIMGCNGVKSTFDSLARFDSIFICLDEIGDRSCNIAFLVQMKTDLDIGRSARFTLEPSTANDGEFGVL